VEEAVAEEFDGGGEVFSGHAVEATIRGEKAVGGEDVEVRVEDQIVAEGVDGGDGSEFAIGEVEASAALLRQGYEGHSSLPLALRRPAIRSFRHGSEEWWRCGRDG
jgi:hypothetical protein